MKHAEEAVRICTSAAGRQQRSRVPGNNWGTDRVYKKGGGRISWASPLIRSGTGNLNGLFSVRRMANGYRVYTEEDMQRLTIIRSLRCANYSLSSILRMLNALSRNPSADIRKIIDTPGEDDDIITACDKLLTSLAEAKENAGYVESQIGKLIEMNRRNSCERQL